MTSRFSTRLMPSVGRDGAVVIAASALRSLDYGFLSVFLGVYLSLLDFSVFQAGLVFSAIMGGGTLSNAIASWRGDTIGRKRMLMVMAVLMGIGGILYPFASNVTTLALISLIAMTTSTGGDRTAFLSLDMAILAQTVEAEGRTAAFSWYNLIGRFTKAIGSLLIAVPAILQQWFGIGEVDSFRAMFWAYSGVAFSGLGVYWLLTPLAERRREPNEGANQELPPGTRGIMFRLTALFSMDALGGGFMVNGFISFWFTTRFGVSLETIAGIFFAGQILNSISLALATPLARKIGLIATMAYTQGVSNILMILMALTGNLWFAVGFFMLRELSNEMDVPTRQSYSMAIVPPEARTAMAGMTNLGRTFAQTVSPGMAGLVAQTTFLGAPMIAGSIIKLVYNAALLMTFRSIKAPEEEARAKQQASQPDPS
ncbi:MAG: MFS transporter [SAR202 cluster bacterium]|nr:MFS transporter [SAR202 cluster bacterium]